MCVYSTSSLDKLEYTHMAPLHRVHVGNKFSDRIKLKTLSYFNYIFKFQNLIWDFKFIRERKKFSTSVCIFFSYFERTRGDKKQIFRTLFFNRLNNRFLRERGMASTIKMEYQVFLCIFQKNKAMATLCFKEMGIFLLEGRETGLPYWLSQFN